MEDAKKIIKKATPNFQIIKNYKIGFIVLLVGVVVFLIMAIVMGNVVSYYSSDVVNRYTYAEIIVYSEYLQNLFWFMFYFSIAGAVLLIILYLTQKKQFDKMSFEFYEDSLKAVIYDKSNKGMVTKVWKYSEIKSVSYIKKYGVKILVDKQYVLKVAEIDDIYYFLAEKTK